MAFPIVCAAEPVALMCFSQSGWGADVTCQWESYGWLTASKLTSQTTTTKKECGKWRRLLKSKQIASWHQLTWAKCVQSTNDSYIQIFLGMAVRSVCWQSLSSVWVNALTVFPQQFRMCVGFLTASWQSYLGYSKRLHAWTYCLAGQLHGLCLPKACHQNTRGCVLYCKKITWQVFKIHFWMLILLLTHRLFFYLTDTCFGCPISALVVLMCDQDIYNLLMLWWVNGWHNLCSHEGGSWQTDTIPLVITPFWFYI